MSEDPMAYDPTDLPNKPPPPEPPTPDPVQEPIADPPAADGEVPQESTEDEERVQVPVPAPAAKLPKFCCATCMYGEPAPRPGVGVVVICKRYPPTLFMIGLLPKKGNPKIAAARPHMGVADVCGEWARPVDPDQTASPPEGQA